MSCRITSGSGKNHARVLTLILFISLTATTASAQGIGIGVGPSEVLFENLIKGGYAETNLVVSTAADKELSISISKEGEIADWITITPREFILPAKGRKEVLVVIEPPGDAKNRVYEAKLYVTAAPIADIKAGTGSALGARVAVKIQAKLTGVEIIDYRIIDARVFDTELGYPIEFHLRIKNDGNVKYKPKIRLNISGPAIEPDFNLITAETSEIWPSRMGDAVITAPSEELKVGDYTAEVGYFTYARDPKTNNIVENYVPYKKLKFRILAEGAISAKGGFESLVLDKTRAGVGDTVKISGVFKNMGEVLLKPRLDCEVLDGDQFEANVEGKESAVPPGQSKSIEAYYTPDSKGEFDITCLVSYAGYETEKKTVKITVGGGLGVEPTHIILIVVVIIAAFAAYKKGYLTGGRGGGGFQEV